MTSSVRAALGRERSLFLGIVVIAVLWLIPGSGGGLMAQAPFTPNSSTYNVSVFAEVQSPYGVTVVPSHLIPDFGNNVYISSLSNGSDYIYGLQTDGSLVSASPLPDDDSNPIALEFPRQPGFGNVSGLYISAINRDDVPGQCGGAVMTMTPAGNFSDFTSLSGPYECDGSTPGTAVGFPLALAFAHTDVSPQRLYVTSDFLSQGTRLLEVNSNGSVSFVTENLTGPLAFDVDGLFGGIAGGALYAVEGGGAWEIRRAVTTGDPDEPFYSNTSELVVSLNAPPLTMKFANGGIFGTGLFVGLADGLIYRLSLFEGEFSFEPIAGGFSSFFVDSIEFSNDGQRMYVVDPNANRVYVLTGGDDADADGVGDLSDNCVNTPNSDQADLDGDGEGDACDPDDDGDNVNDDVDNCPTTPNDTQSDVDNDGLGDACDLDNDGDAIIDNEDNCPLDPNPDQADGDNNGVGDVCDDDDADGVFNDSDNCPVTPNPDQADTNGDGQGNVCDLDDDGDSVLDEFDLCPAVPGTVGNNGCPGADPFQTLIDHVDATGLSNGLKNSLIAKVNNAKKAAEKGNTNAAINLLQAFINEVQSLKRTGKLPAATADALIAEAQALIFSLQ